MFLLDSLMISGIKWVMNTVITSAEAEMNDDTALREQLLEAEMRREMGEISDDEFVEIEQDLLGRIREIKQRREGGSGPLAMGTHEAVEKGADSRFQVEASVSGDFYDPADAPHTTIVESEPAGARSGEQITVLDMQRAAAEPQPAPGLPLSAPSKGRKGGQARKGSRHGKTTRTTRTTRTGRLSK